MLRALTSLALVALTAAALSGCASSSGEGLEPGTEPTSSPLGTWRAEAPGTAWLEIADDGAVSGNDGCNQFTGTAAVDGDTVAFTMGLSTLMACTGVTISFSDLVSATVEGDILTTRYADGAEIVVLQRAE